MTSEPETTKQAVATEPEFASREHESINWGKADSRAEPQPEWSLAIDTWGIAWDLHQYGLGVCYGLVGFCALVAFVKVLKSNAAARQKKVSLVVLSQIVLFGFSRCVFLCVDAYNSKQYLHITVLNLIWGIGQPCLITAFMLIFLVLRNALVMKGRFQNWYTSRNIAFITVPYFTFVFTSEVVVSLIPSSKILLFACQIINTTLYFSIACFYVFISALIWRKLGLIREKASKMHVRGQQKFPILKSCLGAVVGGFTMGAVQVYAMLSVYSVFSDADDADAWPWFAFQTSMRCLEMAMAVLLYMTGTQNTAEPATRKVDVAPQSKLENVAEPNKSRICSSGYVAQHFSRNTAFTTSQLDLQGKAGEDTNF